MLVPDDSQMERLERELHEERERIGKANHAEYLQKQLQDKIDAENEPCEHCGGVGYVNIGEHDDIVTKKCICRLDDGEDEDRHDR